MARYYTSRQCAEVLHYSQGRVQQMLREGLIRGTKPGGRGQGGEWRITDVELERVAKGIPQAEDLREWEAREARKARRIHVIEVEPELAKRLMPQAQVPQIPVPSAEPPPAEPDPPPVETPTEPVEPAAPAKPSGLRWSLFGH